MHLEILRVTFEPKVSTQKYDLSAGNYLLALDPFGFNDMLPSWLVSLSYLNFNYYILNIVINILHHFEILI